MQYYGDAGALMWYVYIQFILERAALSSPHIINICIPPPISLHQPVVALRDPSSWWLSRPSRMEPREHLHRCLNTCMMGSICVPPLVLAPPCWNMKIFLW